MPIEGPDIRPDIEGVEVENIAQIGTGASAQAQVERRGDGAVPGTAGSGKGPHRGPFIARRVESLLQNPQHSPFLPEVIATAAILARQLRPPGVREAEERIGGNLIHAQFDQRLGRLFEFLVRLVRQGKHQIDIDTFETLADSPVARVALRCISAAIFCQTVSDRGLLE